MNSKERMMLALNREKPDRLPVTVHQWQGYHLDTYMGGITALEAFKQVGLDAQIQYFQDMGQFWLVDADMSKLNTPSGATRSRRSAATRTTASPTTPSTRPKAR